MISFRSTTKCSLAAGSIVGLLATIICPLAEAFTLFETAALGPTGIADAGFEITNVQSVGARFEVTSPVTTTRVGAHLIDSAFPYVGNKQVYAAIIALSGPTDLPDSTILITPDVVGEGTAAAAGKQRRSFPRHYRSYSNQDGTLCKSVPGSSAPVVGAC